MPSLVKISKLIVEKCLQILNFDNVLLLFRNNLPIEKGMALHLNKHKFPLPKVAFCQVWPRGSGEEDF